MKKIILILLLFLAGVLFGQTTVIARSALADTSFNRNSLYVEFVQQRGKNVWIDCGYQDAGTPYHILVFFVEGDGIFPRNQNNSTW